jgi:hypothetical protein
MPMTSMGFLLVAFMPWVMARLGRIIAFTQLTVVFDASAALIVYAGSFGVPIQPAYFSGIFLVGFATLFYLSGKSFHCGRLMVSQTWPLLAFTAYAVVSALLLPLLFEGQVNIWPQRADPTGPGMVALIPTSGNMTQTGYLVFDVMVCIVLASYVRRRPEFAQQAFKTLLIAGHVAVVLAFWQWMNRVAGVPFPSDMIFSNTLWEINDDQVLGGVARMAGSFPEPSMLALYFAGIYFCTLWLYLRGDTSRSVLILLFCSLMVLVISTSTTAYIVVALGSPLLFAMAVGGGRAKSLRRVLMLIGCAIMGVLLTIFVATNIYPEMAELFWQVVSETADKKDSLSYTDRSTKDLDSLMVIGPTFGLGAGWGSIRASSLIATTAGNAGLVGLVFLGLFAFKLRRLTCAATAAVRHEWKTRRVIEGLAASLAGMLLAAAISIPSLTFLGFWLNLGLLIGLCLAVTRNRPSVAADRFLSTSIISEATYKEDGWRAPPARHRAG